MLKALSIFLVFFLGNASTVFAQQCSGQAWVNVVASEGPKAVRRCQTSELFCSQLPTNILFGEANIQRYGRELLGYVGGNCQIGAETYNGPHYGPCGGHPFADQMIATALARYAAECQRCPPQEARELLEGFDYANLSSTERNSLAACGFSNSCGDAWADPNTDACLQSQDYCETSQNVADRQFTIDGQTHSCRTQENGRAELYNELIRIQTEEGFSNSRLRDRLVKNLDDYADQLEGLQDSSSDAAIGLGLSGVSLDLAIIGLLLCPETGGATCLLLGGAGVGVSVAGGASSVGSAPTLAELDAVRANIREARAELMRVDEEQWRPLRDKFRQANRMCEAIRAQCVD